MQIYGLVMHEKQTLSSLINTLMSVCSQLSYIECHVDEEDKIVVVFKALPMEYNQIVMVLKEKESIPSSESIISSLQEEDKKISKEVSTSSAYVITIAKTFSKCQHCGKTNHP